MRLTVVGSGTAVPEPDRVCSGYLVEAGDARLLLDCGPGVVHRLAALDLPWRAIDHVFLTHFHNDHTGDLPMLLFALKWGLRPARSAPLTLWGPRKLSTRLRAMEAAFGSHVADPGFPLVIRELAPGDQVDLGPATIRVGDTPHTPESVCYRVDAGGARLAYTGDTGPSDDVARFLAGADLLLAECSLPDDEAMDTHLTPASAARLADLSRPGRLLLTHVYPQLGARDPVARVREAGWTGPCQWVGAGAAFELEPGGRGHGGGPEPPGA